MNLSPQTVREQVTNRIRNELVAGQFQAGTMLREIELANRLGVSRGPVRDAFIQLSHEGYLAYQANRGVMVRRPPDPADRSFITSIRVQIETHVIEKGLAAVTDEAIEQVSRALERLKQACQLQQATDIAISDIQFHEAIMVACGGEDLVSAWRQLCSRMLLTYSRLGDCDLVYREHSAIFEAFKSKDLAATIEAITANIR